MDAALSQQLRSVWGRQTDGDSLETRFPSLGRRHIEDALGRATMLLAAAFAAGHRALMSIDVDMPSIVADLRARHPGFSDAGYREVITFGCFLAR
jgi:hypothetical protein